MPKRESRLNWSCLKRWQRNERLAKKLKATLFCIFWSFDQSKEFLNFKAENVRQLSMGLEEECKIIKIPFWDDFFNYEEIDEGGAFTLM